MKIKQLNVTNYKSLIEAKIEEMGDTNLYYGYNNSGKSNIFKFLELVFKPKEFTDTITSAAAGIAQSLTLNQLDFWKGEIYRQPFIFSNNTRKTPITFSIELEVENNLLPNSQELLGLKFMSGLTSTFLIVGEIISMTQETSAFHLLEAKLNKTIVYSDRDNKEAFFPQIKKPQFDKKEIGQNLLSHFNNCVLLIDTERNFGKEPKTGSTKNVTLTSRNFKKWLYELSLNADSHDRFIELLSFLKRFSFSAAAATKIGTNLKSFPLTKADISFSEFSDELEIMLSNDIGGRIPLKNYGTGIQQFIYMLGKIFNSDAKIIFIEELELNLSPVFQEELLNFLKNLMPEKISQLHFTSHSPYFTSKTDKVDFVHHVQLGNSALNNGTNIESYDKSTLSNITDDENPLYSYFHSLYS